MKMPAIQQTGVSRAESVSSGQIISAAQSSINNSNGLVKLVSDYTSSMNKIEAVTEYNQYFNSSMTTLEAGYDEMMQSPQYDDNGKANYSQLGDSWGKAFQKHVTDTSKLFDNATARTQYQSEMSTYLRKSMGDVRGVQRTRQKDHAVGQLNIALNAFKRKAGGAEAGVQAIDQMVTLGLIDFASGSDKTIKFLNEHQMTQQGSAIENATTEGELDMLRGNLLSEPSQFLSSGNIRSLFSAIGSKESRVREAYDEKQEDNHAEIFRKMLDGEISTYEQLEAELTSENITFNQFDDLSERLQSDMTGPEFDNWSELIKVKTSIDSYSEIDILTNSELTRDTRLALIGERRAMIKTAKEQGLKSANWTSTQDGKLALETINSIDFGAMKIAGLGMTNTNKDVFLLKRKLFEELGKLPVEAREGKALSIADDLVAGYHANESVRKKVKVDQGWYDILADAEPADWPTIIQSQKRSGKSPPSWLKGITTDEALEDMAESLGVKL